MLYAKFPYQSVSMTSAPTQYNLNGSAQTVEKNTGNPALNRPLPMELLDATGVVDVRTALSNLLTELQAKTEPADTQPISAAALPLPTGASSEATLSALNGKVTACNTGAVTVSTSALPTGASTEATLSTMSGKIVSQADDCVDIAYYDYASTPANTGAYTEIKGALSSDCKEMEIFDSSGQLLLIASGGISSEVDKAYIVPGGNGKQRIKFNAGDRISVKPISANADAGFIAINFYN